MYVYVLRSEKDGKRYIGLAADVARRLKEHNSGLVFSTKGRRPFTIVYVEKCETLGEARSREKHYKSAAGRRKLNQIERSGPRSSIG